MSFRISAHKKNGQRTGTVLIDAKEGIISNQDSADLTFPLPENTSVIISENDGKLTIKTIGVGVHIKGREIKDQSLAIGTSTEFQIGEQEFYTTVVLTGDPTPRKKSYLSAIALSLIWSLLAIQLVVPLWLPNKIKVHKVKGRNVLIENCSIGLDTLRNRIKDTQKGMDKLSQIHRDIMVRVNDEVEQIAWVFRNAGEFMSQSELEKLEQDIKAYEEIIGKLKTTDAVIVKPLSTDQAVKNILKKDQ